MMRLVLWVGGEALIVAAAAALTGLFLILQTRDPVWRSRYGAGALQYRDLAVAVVIVIAMAVLLGLSLHPSPQARASGSHAFLTLLSGSIAALGAVLIRSIRRILPAWLQTRDA